MKKIQQPTRTGTGTGLRLALKKVNRQQPDGKGVTAAKNDQKR